MTSGRDVIMDQRAPRRRARPIRSHPPTSHCQRRLNLRFQRKILADCGRMEDFQTATVARRPLVTGSRPPRPVTIE